MYLCSNHLQGRFMSIFVYFVDTCVDHRLDLSLLDPSTASLSNILFHLCLLILSDVRYFSSSCRCGVPLWRSGLPPPLSWQSRGRSGFLPQTFNHSCHYRWALNHLKRRHDVPSSSLFFLLGFKLPHPACHKHHRQQTCHVQRRCWPHHNGRAGSDLGSHHRAGSNFCSDDRAVSWLRETRRRGSSFGVSPPVCQCLCHLDWLLKYGGGEIVNVSLFLSFSLG